MSDLLEKKIAENKQKDIQGIKNLSKSIIKSFIDLYDGNQKLKRQQCKKKADFFYEYADEVFEYLKKDEKLMHEFNLRKLPDLSNYSNSKQLLTIEDVGEIYKKFLNGKLKHEGSPGRDSTDSSVVEIECYVRTMYVGNTYTIFGHGFGNQSDGNLQFLTNFMGGGVSLNLDIHNWEDHRIQFTILEDANKVPFDYET